MSYWREQKLKRGTKRTHIRLTEIDCEIFGYFLEIIQKLSETPHLIDELSDFEKNTLQEGITILSDINWFGWKCRTIKKSFIQ